MIFRILFIVGLFSLMSCSVTKRVHLKGFHVKWNGNFSKKNDQRNDLLLNFDRKIVESELVYYDTLLTTNSVRLEEEKIDSASALYIEKENSNDYAPKNSEGFKDIWKTFTHDVTPKNVSLKKHDRLEEEEVSDSEFETLEILGIVLLSLGVLFLLGSLILVIGFNGLDGLFSALVFSGNGIVAGVFGFVLFLMILLLLVLFMFLIEFIGGFGVGFILGGLMVGAGFVLLLLNSSRNS